MPQALMRPTVSCVIGHVRILFPSDGLISLEDWTNDDCAGTHVKDCRIGGIMHGQIADEGITYAETNNGTKGVRHPEFSS